MQISHGFSPGTLGEIVALHGRHYAENWGFGPFFEAKVAREMAKFQTRVTDSDLILIAQDEDGVAASLILDLHDPVSGPRGAHLRWFIASERCRGTGIGRKFMALAIEHANQHSNGLVWLTTFAGLDAARHLYEDFGFQLAREHLGEAWGTQVTEQEFRRTTP